MFISVAIAAICTWLQKKKGGKKIELWWLAERISHQQLFHEQKKYIYISWKAVHWPLQRPFVDLLQRHLQYFDSCSSFSNDFFLLKKSMPNTKKQTKRKCIARNFRTQEQDKLLFKVSFPAFHWSLKPVTNGRGIWVRLEYGDQLRHIHIS